MDYFIYSLVAGEYLTAGFSWSADWRHAYLFASAAAALDTIGQLAPDKLATVKTLRSEMRSMLDAAAPLRRASCNVHRESSIHDPPSTIHDPRLMNAAALLRNHLHPINALIEYLLHFCPGLPAVDAIDLAKDTVEEIATLACASGFEPDAQARDDAARTALAVLPLAVRLLQGRFAYLDAISEPSDPPETILDDDEVPPFDPY